MKLPNSYGTAYKFSGNRRRPWVVKKTISGNQKKRLARSSFPCITCFFCAFILIGVIIRRILGFRFFCIRFVENLCTEEVGACLVSAALLLIELTQAEYTSFTHF